jgi:hypothetical protein
LTLQSYSGVRNIEKKLSTLASAVNEAHQGLKQLKDWAGSSSCVENLKGSSLGLKHTLDFQDSPES